MHWIKADASDFRGTIPRPRSGHTAVNVGNSMLVVFGGLADRRFLNDLCVYDTENGIWFTPNCSGTESGSDRHVGPSPRAFHVAVAIDCHMFVFGGRYGNKRLGDFWMLDTDIWQWSELTGFGDLPSPRDFAAASAVGNSKIVMYGGSDGKKWLSDVYILDTISLEWMELSISGSSPLPRCGHTVTMVEKRLLVYGGRGGGGQIMGDLWALKGLIEEENETLGWTQLKLPGQSPQPCCGHTITSGGHYLLMFGGHGIGGWLSRYDMYYNDCTVLDRVSVQWKRLPIRNESPPARAYHSLNSIGSRYLLFGGFDGKSTFGDMWWLVSEGDPIATRPSSSTKFSQSETQYSASSTPSTMKGDEEEYSPLVELQKRIQIPDLSSETVLTVMEETEDKELLELAAGFSGKNILDQVACLQALRDQWKRSTATSIQLKELGPLLRDYQRLLIQHHMNSVTTSFLSSSEPAKQHHYGFFHVKSSSQLRMDDVPKLLNEYKQLLIANETLERGRT